jgi:hypothetical protein
MIREWALVSMDIICDNGFYPPSSLAEITPRRD